MKTDSLDYFISQLQEAYYIDWDSSQLRMRSHSRTKRLSREELNNINICLPLALDEYSRRASSFSLKVTLLKQLTFMTNPRIRIEEDRHSPHQTYWIQDIDSIEGIALIDDPATHGLRSLRISGNMTSTSFYVNFHLRDTNGYVSKVVTDQWLNANFPGAAEKARNLAALGVTNPRECWSLVKQSLSTPSNPRTISIDDVSFD